MKRRCTAPSDDKYPIYGGRGIFVCPEWNDFEAFYAWATTAGYRPGLSIDRINNNGPYSPDNCRWATRATQDNNRRNNYLVSAFGETKTLTEWSQDPRCVVTYEALMFRIKRRDWNSERALTTPTIKNNGQATHCPKGHPYNEENISWDGPDRKWRKCKACMRARANAWYAKKKGSA